MEYLAGVTKHSWVENEVSVDNERR